MYPLGTQVRITGTFEDVTGELADPTVATLYVKRPRQNDSTTYTGSGLVHDSIGVFHHDLVLSAAGTWLYSWEGTGAVQAATFDVPLEVSASALRSS